MLVSLALVSAVLLNASLLSAQVDPNLEQGLKPYGSYHGGDIDRVSLTNGNLFVRIPFYSLPQRGNKLHFGFSLQYNNKGYSIQASGTQCPFAKVPQDCLLQYTGQFQSAFQPGVSGVSLVDDHSITVASQYVNQGVIDYPNGCQVTNPPGNILNPCNLYVWEYSAFTSDGAVHQLADTGNGYYESIDGSGIRYNLSTKIVADADGVQYGGGAQDPNGNQINSLGDTLGLTCSPLSAQS